MLTIIINLSTLNKKIYCNFQLTDSVIQYLPDAVPLPLPVQDDKINEREPVKVTSFGKSLEAVSTCPAVTNIRKRFSKVCVSNSLGVIVSYIFD